MIKSHLLILIIASVLISFVLGFITKDTKEERKRFIIIMIASLVGFCVISAWIMYFLHS